MLVLARGGAFRPLRAAALADPQMLGVAQHLLANANASGDLRASGPIAPKSMKTALYLVCGRLSEGAKARVGGGTHAEGASGGDAASAAGLPTGSRGTPPEQQPQQQVDHRQNLQKQRRHKAQRIHGRIVETRP